jgi:hypothetical protein
MRVGVNYAWHNYGWDFGLPPRKDNGNLWGKRAAFADTLAADLDGLRRLGLFAVRWFLLGDGTTYGIDDARPQPDPADGRTWRFRDCPPLSQEFLVDFELLLSACALADIQLVPSLIDFHFCFPGLPVPGSSGIVKGGRAEGIENPERRRQFFDRALAPLLELCAAYRSTLHAIELINEPEWCTREPDRDSDDANRTVDRAAMAAFIREGAEQIHAAGFLSTVGFAKYETLQRWRELDLGISLLQFHYYADMPVIPPHPGAPQPQLLVGEVATAAHRPWPELGARQDVLSRLRLLAQKDYPAAFLWSANRAEEAAPEPAVDWSEGTRRLVAEFTAESGEDR